jgi:hypothetical protein
MHTKPDYMMILRFIMRIADTAPEATNIKLNKIALFFMGHPLVGSSD